MIEKKRSIVYLQGLSTLVLVVIVIFGITGSAYSAKPPGVTDDTIKVGVIFDQTGPVAILLRPVTTGIRYYFRYINEQGGIHGRKLKTLVEDDRATIPMSISAFKKLVYRDGIVALLGPTSTGGAISLMKSIEKEKIPTIPGSSADRMVNPLNRYIFIIKDTNAGQMKVMIDYIMKDLEVKNPRIGLVYPDNESGKADLDPGLERLKLYNVEPVSKQVLSFGAIDATSQVMNLKRAKVDYVLLLGSPTQPAIVLLREMKKFGLNVPLFGVHATCDESVLAIGDAANNFYAVSFVASWYDEGSGLAKMREIILKYEPGTENQIRGKTFMPGWLDGLIYVEAMKRAGRNLDGDAIVDAIESIKNYDTGGICGPLTFGPTDHKGGSAWKMFKSDPSAGKFIPLTGWREPK
ncbi:MAG: ABC transporter substrate-binding protein [Pseudomonadota bacterium]